MEDKNKSNEGTELDRLAEVASGRMGTFLVLGLVLALISSIGLIVSKLDSFTSY